MNVRLTALIVLLVAAAGGGGWLLYRLAAEDGLVGGPSPEASEPSGTSAVTAKPPLYLNMEPPFLVNFEVQGTLRFLQVSVSVMARSEPVLGAIERHMPFVRNNLLLLLSSQTLDSIATLEAKESLRNELLAELRDVLGSAGEPDQVEALYFTAFVMQ